MKTSLECIPCLIRQATEAVRLVSAEEAVQEQLLRDVLRWASEMDMNGSPPLLAQRIHRRLREMGMPGSGDPYRPIKDRQNRMAKEFLPGLKTRIRVSSDPLALAIRIAIAGNVIDLGAKAHVCESEVRLAIHKALEEPLAGELEPFKQAISKARNILYLADNAGEIVLDRLLIEQLGPSRVTLAVRGAPVINDATRDDARTAGLEGLVEIIDNGSDAPGTLLDDCSSAFRKCMDRADLILAKGQGNYETLSGEARNIFFLFKVKCPVIAHHSGHPLGAHVIARPQKMHPEEETSGVVIPFRIPERKGTCPSSWKNA